MYRAPSKRKKRAQLFFVYSLMITAVLAIVSILVLIMLGYRFNKFDGQIEQGGLVQFDSRPSGATVTVDSTVLSNKTASKITLTTGKHTVIMAKDGYNAWKKDVTVNAGGVLWLNYSLLLPSKLTTKNVYESPTISSAVTSPDKKYLATLGSASDSTISVTPLNDTDPATTKVTISPPSYTVPDIGKSSSFTFVGWDKDSRHMIVRHSYNDGLVEYVSVDLRGQDETRNISRTVGGGISALEFSLADSNIVYVLTDTHELRRVSLSDSNVSAPLLTNVASFSQGDRSTIAYATIPDPITKKRDLGYWTTSSSSPRVLRTVVDAGSRAADISMSTYYSEQYVVFANGTDVEILTGDLPVSDSTNRLSLTQVAHYTLPHEESKIGFSPYENRFVYAQFNGGVWTYDLEVKKLSKTTFEGASPSRPLDWLNTYHFATTNNDMFAFYDFDGTNRQVVNAKVVDLPVAMSENSRYVYHFATTEKGISLIRTKLITD
ncbi:PEGA domain-containing protein [Microbacteriaceae bacterium]|nr:PEGA domain-containing protein [Candidatus Saccharibacteria bacterium]